MVEKDTGYWVCKDHGNRTLMKGEWCPGVIVNDQGGVIRAKPHAEAA